MDYGQRNSYKGFDLVPELNILELHESLKIFPRISPLLIMRRTKHTYDACVDICKQINKLRDGKEFGKTDHNKCREKERQT